MNPKRGLTGAVAALLAVAGGVHAEPEPPSAEACVLYAEADLAFERAKVDALTIVYEKAKANGGDVTIRKESHLDLGHMINIFGNITNAIRYSGDNIIDITGIDAVEGITFYEKRKNDAQVELNKTYYEIYNDSDGVESDEEEIMTKLMNHHRGICKELYGI